jgi:hypothetical protein
LFAEFNQIPSINGNKNSKSKTNRRSTKKPEYQISPKRINPIDKLIEDELNISDLATPHELNEEEKRNLYKKYNLES